MIFDRYIGIDPGKGGAIAHIGKGDMRPISVSMPKSVDEINTYLTYLKSISDSPVACIEKVSLWGADYGAGKMFGIEKLIANFKELTTTLTIVKIPFIQVLPIQWQSYLKVKQKKTATHTEKKRVLKMIAQGKFLNNTVTLTNCDALLIMYYLALKCQREQEWVLHRIPKSVVQGLNFNKL